MRQRIIKFRAWDTDEKYLYPLKEEANLSLFPSQRYLLLQFTGLCDKNGEEIYEGDVVRINDSYNQEVYDIRYVQHLMGYISRPEDGCSVEVIGNIYEDPELLKTI